MIVALTAASLVGCSTNHVAPVREDEKTGSYVYIFSTRSTTIAQAKADKMCGSHSYFISNPEMVDASFYMLYPIRFNCDLNQAAYEGSAEAIKILKEENLSAQEKAYTNYMRETEKIKETRRKNANPNKYESYTITDPDGTIRSYSFFGGKTCESISYSSGTAETHCD
ncbi:hypothetical protein ABG178_004746 [Salmonella enterica]|nr:hypothetical protein [Salmonella enterica]EBM7685459.1 hypothetical protein [Salmonella enterica subsp. enterica serovar Muenchen]ELJ2701306.1 hypothetical protein [Salmonella enterica subsp. enterica]EAO4948469.1 hypothetical protein [Salmonella enterica]EAP4861070.1 hypothetical protein [Salmonella enterica]